MSAEAKAAAASLSLLVAAGVAGCLCVEDKSKKWPAGAEATPPPEAEARASPPAAALAVVAAAPPPTSSVPAAPPPPTPLALWKAAHAGDASRVVQLLAAGADKDEVRLPQCRGCDGVRSGKSVRCRSLLVGALARTGEMSQITRGCVMQVNHVDDGSYKRTALCAASARGNLECVAALLAAGAAVHATDAGAPGWAPLHYASYDNHEAVVAELLAAPGAAVDQPTAGKGGFSLTPLHIAAQAGSTAAARVLVRAGAAIGARDVRYAAHCPPPPRCVVWTGAPLRNVCSSCHEVEAANGYGRCQRSHSSHPRARLRWERCPGGRALPFLLLLREKWWQRRQAAAVGRKSNNPPVQHPLAKLKWQRPLLRGQGRLW
eukprot:COSAG01_NODE_2300_length_7954_cov_7.117250_8_plen_375_part_00